MTKKLRESGIDVLGDIPWGKHFCQFYETQEDLFELLVPYFKAGLENNEFCLWVTCDSLTVEKAYAALSNAVPNLHQYLEKQSIEILSCLDWHINGDDFSARTIINKWKEKLHNALERGFEGMRVNGNEIWLRADDREDFINYEKELDYVLHNQPVIVLCTYPLSKTPAGALLDVAHTHGCVVSKRKGQWEILEKPDLKKSKAFLKRKSDELEQWVAERTSELSMVIEELKIEIAERKKAEDKLKREKDLSKSIIESFPGIFKIIDKNNRILNWNRMLEVVSGYTPMEIPHLHALDDFHEFKDHKRIIELMEQAYTTGKVSAEVNMRMKDGRILNFYYIARPINYNGIPCLITSGIDITERKKAEAQLIKEKMILNQILDSIPGLVVMFDENFRYIRWNKNFELATGYSSEELPTLHAIDDIFQDESSKQAAYQLAKETLEKGTVSGDVVPLFKNGHKITYHIEGRRINYEGKTCLLCVGIDITERKEAERELSLAYKRLSYHVENSPLAVIECDRNMKVKRWSARAEEIFGWKEPEVLGKKIIDFNLIYEDDRKIVEQQVEELLRPRRPVG
jgi:PAS domain S-box-containing protein